MTNFEMILKNPDYQHVIRESLIRECAVSNNHLHLCNDLDCAECQAERKGHNCMGHVGVWLDEEFRPVFKREEESDA